MIYTVCIKTNNTEIINYLLKNIEELNLENTKISNNKFKLYENVMVHYTGKLSSLFYSSIETILANCILVFYEADITRKIISSNYFYFSDLEKKEIYKKCILNLSASEIVLRKFNIVSNAAKKYFLENKQMLLDGIVNFRIKEYMQLLDETIDLCVDEFLVEREYAEFVNLLKSYISSNPSNANIVYIIYINKEAVLLNENGKVIDYSSYIPNVKYLSDISFSANDYALNTLLTLLPKEIIIHLNLINEKDEFIKTLELIFENRIIFCENCNICNELCKLRKENSYD